MEHQRPPTQKRSCRKSAELLTWVTAPQRADTICPGAADILERFALRAADIRLRNGPRLAIKTHYFLLPQHNWNDNLRLRAAAQCVAKGPKLGFTSILAAAYRL